MHGSYCSPVARYFSGGQVELFGELARLVERAEVRRVGLQRAQVMLVGLRAGDAGRNAGRGEERAGVREAEADAAQRERVAGCERDAAPPVVERGVLAVVVPLAAAEVVPGVGKVRRGGDRRAEDLLLLEAVREDVVGGHPVGGR